MPDNNKRGGGLVNRGGILEVERSQDLFCGGTGEDSIHGSGLESASKLVMCDI